MFVKNLARLMKGKKEKKQLVHIRNEYGVITTDSIEIKLIIINMNNFTPTYYIS